VLVAPVADAPVAIEVMAGDSFESEAEVNGEAIGGNPRWHLVTAGPAPDTVRGFIHSSLVAAQETSARLRVVSGPVLCEPRKAPLARRLDGDLLVEREERLLEARQ
jgi:hypothetical protein